ncbi:adenosylcobinamide-GDP ribazoletransferase [Bradyrhizobium lablabi]|nr:adenosylcobinamide-GDP ribazoletransferase [Bradyrhizobium lablabi]
MCPGRFFDAARFLTILPIGPSDDRPDSEWLARSLKFFPAVGFLVGLVSAAVLLLASPLWGPTIAALLAVLAGSVVTGALHEDGLADTADAFGGGWTPEQRTAIMKDSRIGTFGALALIFSVALRVAALALMPPSMAAGALLVSGAASRASLLPVIDRMNYAGDTSAMKVSYSHSPLRGSEYCFAGATLALASAPLIATFTPVFLLPLFGSAVCGAMIAAALALWSRRSIGGYTGDVLGAIVQTFEISFLLALAASTPTAN